MDSYQLLLLYVLCANTTLLQLSQFVALEAERLQLKTAKVTSSSIILLSIPVLAFSDVDSL